MQTNQLRLRELVAIALIVRELGLDRIPGSLSRTSLFIAPSWVEGRQIKKNKGEGFIHVLKSFYRG